MPKYSMALDPVFAALADSTRRSVVERLSEGPASVSTLAAPFDMSLPAFVQHLRVLEDCGLVGSDKQGRVRTCYLRKDALDSAEQWLVGTREYWESRIDALTEYVETEYAQSLREDGQS